MRSASLIIAVDFDGVICKNTPSLGKEFPPLVPGAVAALREIHSQGHFIIIYTCRGDVQRVSEFLDSNGIPYDRINSNLVDTPEGLFNPGKPLAHVYIDDRAIHFESWENVLNEISLRFPGAF